MYEDFFERLIGSMKVIYRACMLHKEKEKNKFEHFLSAQITKTAFIFVAASEANNFSSFSTKAARNAICY